MAQWRKINTSRMVAAGNEYMIRYSLFSVTQILSFGLLYNEFLLCYDIHSSEEVK